jgi:uncharacterized protein YkwD
MFAALCRARCAAVIASVTVACGGFATAAQAKPHHRHHHHHHRHAVRRAAAVQAAAQTAQAGSPQAASSPAASQAAQAQQAQPAQTTQPSAPATASEAMPATATDSCANADTPATQATQTQMTLAVDCLINEQRLAHGLPEMQIATDLNDSAQSWTDQMIQSNQFTHGTDSQFSARITASGYDWQEAGENIASGQQTPRDAVAAWMASPEHCSNIMNPDYRDMGTGETPQPVSSVASDGATWTQDFGLDANQNPLSQNTAPQAGCPYTIPSSPQG